MILAVMNANYAIAYIEAWKIQQKERIHLGQWRIAHSLVD